MGWTEGEQHRWQIEPMDRDYIDQHHLVARYLADELADTEREAFESYFLAHPEIMRELEAAARFKVGLAQLRDAGALQAVMEGKRWFARPRVWAAAAAAAVLMAAVLFTATQPPAQPLLAHSASTFVDRFGTPLSVAETYTILSKRGSVEIDVELPRDAHSIELQVLPELDPPAARYRIRLSAVSAAGVSTEIATLSGLVANNEGFIPVFLNAQAVQPGRYALVLSADEGADSAQNESKDEITFWLRMRQAGAR